MSRKDKVNELCYLCAFGIRRLTDIHSQVLQITFLGNESILIVFFSEFECSVALQAIVGETNLNFLSFHEQQTTNFKATNTNNIL